MDKIFRLCLCVSVIVMAFLVPSPIWASDGATVNTGVASTSQAQTLVRSVRVVIDAEPHLQQKYADMARRIIPIRPGTSFTDEAVDKAVKILKLSRRFSTIHVKTVPDTDGKTLIFTLTPYRYVKEIRIKNCYPLFEQDILNQMTIYPGDPLKNKDLSGQADAIVKRYKREGYIDPKIAIQTRQEPDGETAVVMVDIEKGSHYRLGTLAFTGNRDIGEKWLKPRMQIWRTSLVPFLGRFSEYRLAQDLKNLTRYYWRRGYFDVRLSSRLLPPDKRNRVDVTIEIEENKHYRIAFVGNTHFWNLTLKKDVVLFAEGNRNGSGIRKSIRNIRRRYENAGYQDTRVRVETVDVPGESTNLRRFRFVIEEGPRTIVNAVTISGNRKIEEDRIRKQMLTRPPSLFHSGAFVHKTLDEDIYAITTLYMKDGFRKRIVDADVKTSGDRTDASIAIQIDEGPRTLVRSIDIENPTVLPEAKLKKALIHKVGGPFRESALQAEKEAIVSLMSEQGYPHADVDAHVDISDDGTQADIVHRVNPGPLVKLGEIFISGNLRTDEKVIRRELAVTPDTPLSLRTLYEGQRRLRDLNIFHGVRYRTFGLKENEDTVNLFVDVEEEAPYYFQAGGGYESDTGIFGRARVGDRNIFGLNKELWAAGEISETGYRVETHLTEPRFLGTRIMAGIGLANEEITEFNQPFGTRTTSGSLSFGRKWGSFVATALSFRVEKRDQFIVDDGPVDQQEEEVRTIFVTTPSIRYDSRDSFVRPTKGFFSSLSVDLSEGIDNEVDDFVRYLLDTRIYRSPLPRLTFAGLARIGQVHPYSADEQVPDDQLFFLGGIRDVRGYEENLFRFDENGNPVGGKTAVVGSLEARIDLGRNWELTTFFDIGSVRNTQVPGGSDRFRSSVGLGLRYLTPIGPIGLLYGHKLDREEGESAGRFHLSIGYSF